MQDSNPWKLAHQFTSSQLKADYGKKKKAPYAGLEPTTTNLLVYLIAIKINQGDKSAPCAGFEPATNCLQLSQSDHQYPPPPHHPRTSTTNKHTYMINPTAILSYFPGMW